MADTIVRMQAPLVRGGTDIIRNSGARRASVMHSKCYAALDLGTNNCRLLIARPHGRRFIVMDAFSRIVRLGEGLSATGQLSDEAMDRTIAALKICADKLIKRKVHISRAVATQACRSARNGADFVRRVQKETGIVLDIISTSEEARLAVQGCYNLLPKDDSPALIFDIGGGSTELVVVDTKSENPHILDWLSVPWGVVSLSEAEPDAQCDVATRTAIYKRMRQHVRESFSAFAEKITRYKAPSGTPQHLLGTSGTVTTLGSIYLNLDTYDRSKIDGLTVPAIALNTICQNLAKQSLHERAAVPCIGYERADLVVAGCAILEEIIQLWPTVEVGIADRGIREGILLGLMHQHGHEGRQYGT